MTNDSRDRERSTSLSRLDDAFRAFEAAFAAVPDAALGYRPANDDYALSGLVEHLAGSMRHYAAVLELVRRGRGDGFVGRVRDAAQDQDAAVVSAGIRPEDRADAVEQLRSAYARLTASLAAVPGASFTEGLPVLYGDDPTPYVTSARDVATWVHDHCADHAVQIGTLLEAWASERSAPVAGM